MGKKPKLKDEIEGSRVMIMGTIGEVTEMIELIVTRADYEKRCTNQLKLKIELIRRDIERERRRLEIVIESQKMTKQEEIV
jgi:hypothetical protein